MVSKSIPSSDMSLYLFNPVKYDEYVVSIWKGDILHRIEKKVFGTMYVSIPFNHVNVFLFTRLERVVT